MSALIRVLYQAELKGKIFSTIFYAHQLWITSKRTRLLIQVTKICNFLRVTKLPLKVGENLGHWSQGTAAAPAYQEELDSDIELECLVDTSPVKCSRHILLGGDTEEDPEHGLIFLLQW